MFWKGIIIPGSKYKVFIWSTMGSQMSRDNVLNFAWEMLRLKTGIWNVWTYDEGFLIFLFLFLIPLKNVRLNVSFTTKLWLTLETQHICKFVTIYTTIDAASLFHSLSVYELLYITITVFLLFAIIGPYGEHVKFQNPISTLWLLNKMQNKLHLKKAFLYIPQCGHEESLGNPAAQMKRQPNSA